MCVKAKGIRFFGLHFSPEGMKLSQSKIDAIMNAARPNDIKLL
jgi:hypothetical protein